MRKILLNWLCMWLYGFAFICMYFVLHVHGTLAIGVLVNMDAWCLAVAWSVFEHALFFEVALCQPQAHEAIRCKTTPCEYIINVRHCSNTKVYVYTFSSRSTSSLCIIRFILVLKCVDHLPTRASCSCYICWLLGQVSFLVTSRMFIMASQDARE